MCTILRGELSMRQNRVISKISEIFIPNYPALNHLQAKLLKKESKSSGSAVEGMAFQFGPEFLTYGEKFPHR